MLERLGGGGHVRALRAPYPYLPVHITQSAPELGRQLRGDLIGDLARHPARRDQTQHDCTIAALGSGHTTPTTPAARPHPPSSQPPGRGASLSCASCLADAARLRFGRALALNAP